MSHDVREAARIVDERRRAISPSDELRVRIQRSVARASVARRQRTQMLVAAGIALAFGLGWALSGRSRARPASIAGHMLPGLHAHALADPEPDQRLEAEPCSRRDHTGEQVLDGLCRVLAREVGVRIATVGPTVLGRPATDAFSVEHGWALFEVERQPPGAHVRVEVAAGTIDVVGTRFAIYQDQIRGHLELTEGRIDFTDRRGRVTALVAGDRIAWHGAELVPEAPVTAVGQGPRAASTTAAAVAVRREGLDDVARLRAQGEYARALALVRRLLARTHDPRVQQVLHYEAGTLLEGPLQRHDEACAHWHAHLRRYPDADDRDDVRARIDALGCDRGN